jgi:putative ABC transport system ATP-binding protein
MNLLGCLDTPTSGYILNGKDVSQMRDDELAEIRNKEIGFVFKPSTFTKNYRIR